MAKWLWLLQLAPASAVSIVCTEIVAHLHGCDAVCGTNWNGSACSRIDGLPPARSKYCIGVLDASGCSRMCGLSWTGSACVASTAAFSQAKQRLEQLSEQGGPVSATTSEYCAQMIEWNHGCDDACGYTWSVFQDHLGSYDREEHDAGDRLRHVAATACVQSELTDQVALDSSTPMYCRLIGERIHAGCSLACGQTWSDARGRCVPIQSARPREADNAWEEYRRAEAERAERMKRDEL